MKASCPPPTCNRDTTGDAAPYNICEETEYNPDGSVSEYDDPLANTTQNTYDDLGRLSEVTDPLLNTVVPLQPRATAPN